MGTSIRFKDKMISIYLLNNDLFHVRSPNHLIYRSAPLSRFLSVISFLFCSISFFLPLDIMKNLAFFVHLFYAIGITQAATPCRRDACYNAVATTRRGGPNQASRIRECSIIVGTVIENDRTITRTSTITPSPTTTTITDATITQVITISPFPVVPIVARHPQITPAPVLPEKWEIDFNILMERDKYIIQSRVPSYASACKGPYEYAIACLCFGVQARQNIRPARTVYTTRTVTAERRTVTVLVTRTDTQTTMLTTVCSLLMCCLRTDTDCG